MGTRQGYESGDGRPEAALADVPDGPAPGAQHAQPVDKPVDEAPDGMVPARFGRVSEPIAAGGHHRRTAIAELEAQQCITDAIADGHVIRDWKVRQEWAPLDGAEIERRSRVDRTAPEFVNEDAATIEAFEHSQRLHWAAHWELRTEVDTWAPPTKSAGPQLSQAAHEVLRGMGLQTIAEQEADPRVCGGALLRHAFTPVEAQWLREGSIDRAHCQRCQRDVARTDLLALAEAEAANGTCRTCGDVLEGADVMSHKSTEPVRHFGVCPHGHG